MIKLGIIVFITVTLGAIIQTGLGLGLTVVAMMIFPMFFSINTSVAMITSIGSASAIYLFIRYFKKIQWRILLPCALSGWLVTALFIVISVSANQGLLKIILGCVLIALAIYFAFFSDKIRIKASVASGLFCGGFSGISGGLFGLAGPPLGLYLSAAIPDNESYVATIQTYFVFVNFITIFLRGSYGALSPDILKLIVIGWAAAIIGTLIGIRFFRLLPASLVRKLVYLVIALSGLWTVIQAL